MAADSALVDWVMEALAPVGTVTSRRMMGGATLYLDGTVFAIVADDALWFKSDAVADATWEEAGCARFTYQREGKRATMNYRRAPDDVYDDADAMRAWAQVALEAASLAPRRTTRRRSA